MSFAKAKIRLVNVSKVTVFLDTGAEINIITREIMEDTGLPMQCGAKLESIFHRSHNCSFLGLCNDVKVVIEGFKTRYPIFVIEIEDYNLVLEQLFLNLVKFSQEYKADRTFGTITQLYFHQSVVFQTLTNYNPANRIENRIFSQSLN